MKVQGPPKGKRVGDRMNWVLWVFYFKPSHPCSFPPVYSRFISSQFFCLWYILKDSKHELHRVRTQGSPAFLLFRSSEERCPRLSFLIAPFLSVIHL